jgi:hypothetical protein
MDGDDTAHKWIVPWDNHELNQSRAPPWLIAKE